jgi:hypothetical protein
MLDSLVRVSRRVGGAADLLGREGRTATGCRLLYKSARDPSGPKPGHRELKAREGKQLHPRPLVRSQRFLPSTAGKVRPGGEPAQRAESLLITARRLPTTKLESPADTSRTPPFTTTQFHVLLTLSSKFFSIFHHCTCLLSVSGSYLALRGVYLALWTALPSNPTLERGQHDRTTALRAYHPLRTVATVKLDFD